jgi:hypothetical protein
MKIIYRILIGVAITALVAMIGFYIYILFFGFTGPIEPLRFSVHNNDVNEHNITVEIFDSDNKCIFKERYNLDPEEEVGSPKITKKRGEYTIKGTLDGKITRTYRAKVGSGRRGVRIDVYIKDPISGEIDIWIGQKVA